MVTFDVQQRIQRSRAEVFDFTCRHVFENHPKWEAEVIEWRKRGEPARGMTATMVRKDGGKVREVPVEITDYEPDRTMTTLWRSGPMGMRLTFTVEPVGAAACDFKAHGEIQLYGPIKILTPLFQARSKKLGEKLTRNMRDLLEAPAQAVTPA
jgi:hypothetical protein